MGGEAMEAQRAVVVLKRRVKLVGPMDPAAIDDHHDRCARWAEGRHHLLPIVTELWGIKVRHDCVENFGGAILDCANDAEQDPAGAPAPGALRQPGWACADLRAFDVALAQRACAEAEARRVAPPAGAGQGKAPEQRFVFRAQDALAPASLGLAGGKCEGAVGASSRGGLQSPGGAVGASVLFFHTPRTRSRPSWTPVWWATTVARARQRHGEGSEPCSRGS